MLSLPFFFFALRPEGGDRKRVERVRKGGEIRLKSSSAASFIPERLQRQ